MSANTQPPCRALIYSSRFGEADFAAGHPFRVRRYRLTFRLLEDLGLVARPGVRLVEAPLAGEEDLRLFHEPGYLAVLDEFSRSDQPRANFRYGLGDVENPVFPGMYDWARLGCGGTLEAVRQVTAGGCRVAFSMAGGYHHAQPARASGFSYLNDAVVAIRTLVRSGLRVAYVDLDAHHGDAVQQAFYDSDRVLTISLHENGRDFYPQTGFVEEMGADRGFGYAVNVPFTRHADDLVFEQAFRRVVLPLLDAYRPDLLVTQMGVDGLRTDPLSRLEFTTRSVEFAARTFLETGLPWVALGGGGYDEVNVCRCWALLWAIILGVELPDRLPESFLATLASHGLAAEGLRDRPHLAQPNDFARAQEHLERVLGILERRLFPLHGLHRYREGR